VAGGYPAAGSVVASDIDDATRDPPPAGPPRLRRRAERIALLYALVSAIWIVGSDTLVSLLRLSPPAANLAQTLKGWFFVAASAIFLLLVLRATAGVGADEPLRIPRGRPRAWLPLVLLSGVALALAVTGSIGLRMVREASAALEARSPEARAVPDAEERREAARRLERSGFAVAGLMVALLATAGAGVALWWRNDRRVLEAGQRLAMIEREREAARELAATEERARRALALANAELEARVAARTGDLERVNRELADANRELDAFASSASHDLRAPLRAIDGFARLLAEDHAGALDDEGRRLLGVIRTGAARMGRLIDDLILFARSSRRPVETSLVEMTALVDEVLAELVPDGRRAEIEIVRSPLPAVPGDAGLLRQVWQNLLANALKFSRGRARPRIEITVSREAGWNRFEVSDNGVGFDPRRASRLFGVFERLHSEREFEGSGVGLALVARIVKRHGGEVGAEGEPDRGARFWFRLPALQGVGDRPGRGEDGA